MATPKSGDRVVRVGDTIDLKWSSNDVNSVVIYIKNNNNIRKEITTVNSSNGTTNTFRWNVTEVDRKQFTGSPCNIIIEMANDSTIKDISRDFWILESANTGAIPAERDGTLV